MTNYTGAAPSGSSPRTGEDCEERGYYFWDDSELGYVAWLACPCRSSTTTTSHLRQRVFEDKDGVVRRWIPGTARWTGGGSTSPT